MIQLHIHICICVCVCVCVCLMFNYLSIMVYHRIFFFFNFQCCVNFWCTRNRSGQSWAGFGPQAIVCQILKKPAKYLLPSCPGHIYHKVKESSKVGLRCRNQILSSPFFSLFILRISEQNKVTLIKNVWRSLIHIVNEPGVFILNMESSWM